MRNTIKSHVVECISILHRVYIEMEDFTVPDIIGQAIRMTHAQYRWKALITIDV